MICCLLILLTISLKQVKPAFSALSAVRGQSLCVVLISLKNLIAERVHCVTQASEGSSVALYTVF